MEASFLVSETFTIEARNLFVLAGHVLEGKVKSGMTVFIPMNDDNLIEVTIASVESVNTVDHSAPIGLAVSYEDADDLSILQGLPLKGRKLEIE